MNYLLTLDSNLVDDMIGVRVINSRVIEKTKQNRKLLNDDFIKPFIDSYTNFKQYEPTWITIDDMIDDFIENPDHISLSEFMDLNSIE